MRELANWFSGNDSRAAFGTFADPFSPAGLYRRAHLNGDRYAAQQVAMSCFNRNDLAGYRRWLRLAAKAGDL